MLNERFNCLMKRIVIDEEYLASVSPVYRGFIGKILAILMLKTFGIDKINALCARHADVISTDFTKEVLEDIGVSYKVINKNLLDNLPDGSFITVSNHPFGSADGVILIDILARIRPDFKVMVNGLLTRIKSLSTNFIGVEPVKGRSKSDVSHNLKGVRESIRHIRENHPIGFFPAGAISLKNFKTGTIEDRKWQTSALHLIKQARVLIYPVFFEGTNSWFFHQLGVIGWKIREIRIAHELFNKRGKCFNVHIGEPISVERQDEFSDLNYFGEFLKQKTYELQYK